MLFLVGGIVAAGAVLAYQLGVFDRPEFKFYDTFVRSKDEKQTFLYTILALSTEKSIGRHIERILTGVLKGIEGTITDSEKVLKAASTLYDGTDANSSPSAQISVGLYFDDPTVVDKPRWMAGYAVQGLSYEELQKLIPSLQEKSELTEPIRIVRIGQNSTILKADIPYHSRLTPMVAPIIQWTRAFQAYAKGNYTADCGRPDEKMHSPGIELYHFTTKPSKVCCMHRIEYIVLMGDTASTWDDALPLINNNEATTTSTSTQ